MATIIGQRFNHPHAAGVTRYQVDRPHRDAGYFQCVAIRGVEGSHHFIGSIQVFSLAEILTGLVRCEPDSSGWCRNEFCRVHGDVMPAEVLEDVPSNQPRRRTHGYERPSTSFPGSAAGLE